MELNLAFLWHNTIFEMKYLIFCFDWNVDNAKKAKH
jgi:hypothetical protein